MRRSGMREIMATKKVYLVDTENVGSTWKDLLPVKTGSDQILLFFTENSPYVSYSDLQLILQFPDRFEMIKCNPGKNGLDFQLVSYLGYLMKTASKANYVIVSNDGGFDAVVKFWQERGMSVSRMNVHHVLQPNAGQAVANAAVPGKQETSVQRRRDVSSQIRKAVRGRRPAVSAGTGKNVPSADILSAEPREEAAAVTAETKEEPDSAVVTESAADMGSGKADEKVQNTAAEDMATAAAKTADATDPDSVEAPATKQAPAAGNATADTRAAAAKGTGRKRGRKPAQNAAANREAPPEGTTQENIGEAPGTLPAGNSDTEPSNASEAAGATLTPETASGGADTPSQTPETADADASAGTAADKPAKATRASSRKKAPAADDAPPSAKTPAKRQRKTAAAPLAQPTEPAVSDPENAELDFSNLTVSEKAALLRKYLPKEFSENQESLDIISDIMFGHDTTNHHQLHLAFVKNFGDEKGTLIYKAFRPHLAEFRA